jgi:hypothetical protein
MPNCSSIYSAGHSSSNQEQGRRKVGIDSYKKIKIPLIPKSIFWTSRGLNRERKEFI